MKKIEIILEMQIKDADENMQAPTMFHQIRWREKSHFFSFIKEDLISSMPVTL